MKNKILLLAIILFASVTVSYAQTYFYRGVSTVDMDTGMKSAPRRTGIYITFNNNGCYESDENGNSKSNLYKYRGVTNNLNKYEEWIPPYPIEIQFGKTEGQYLHTILYVTKDKKRINMHMKWLKEIFVFERANPEDIDDDIILY